MRRRPKAGVCGSDQPRKKRRGNCATLGAGTGNFRIAATILVRTVAFISGDFSDDFDLVPRNRCALGYVPSATAFMRKFLIMKDTVREGFEPSIPF